MKTCLLSTLSLLAFPAAAHAALSCGAPATADVELAQQGLYDVSVQASDGSYTAGTGATHPLTVSSGAEQNVLYNGSIDSPDTSSFGVFVYDTGTHYDSKLGTSGATLLGPGHGTCVFDPPDTAEQAATTGLESEWSLSVGGGRNLDIRHEAVAFGTTGGDAGVRLTMTVGNNATSTDPVDVGLRWQLDYQLAGNDAPAFATVECLPVFTENANLPTTEVELPTADVADFFRMENTDLAQTPLFSVFTSSSPLAGFPATDTPDRVVYGNWPEIEHAAWNHPASGNTITDSAVLYYFGATPGEAFTLQPGESVTRSVVIFSAADEGSCGDFQPTGDDDDSATGDDDDSATGDDDDSATGDDDDSATGDDDDSATGDDDDATADDDDATADDDDATGDDDDSAYALPFLQGSGCSATIAPGASTLGLMTLLLAGLLISIRRRPALSPTPLLGLLAPLGMLAVATPSVAQAQVTPAAAIDVQRFDPAPQSRGYTLLRDAEQPRVLTVGTFFDGHYALRPLEIGNAADIGRHGGVIDHLVGFDLGISVAFNEWVQLGVQVPFLHLQAGEDASWANARQLGHADRRAGVGDTTVALGVALLRQGDNAPLSLSLAPRFVLPTGTRDLFVGSGAWGLGGDLAVGARVAILRLTANLGFQVNTVGRGFSNLVTDDEFRWGVGLGIPLLDDQIEPQIEWVGATVINPATLGGAGLGAFAPRSTPSEFALSVFVNPKQGPLWFRVGGGRGIGPGWGGPDLRLFAMVGFDLECNCSDAPGEPQIVERIVEVADPDPDRDGITDADQCPHNPEDMDGFEDEDGCPEWDNDNDTVHDATDRCPDEKEVLNGVDDTDGCPDESLALIDVEKQEIVILDKVYFDLDKDSIKKASLPVLDAVLAVLNDYPSIERVEIQGHTDSRAPDDYNKDLSQRRANAVMKYLVDNGIAAERLIAIGFGEEQMINPNAETEEDHAANRRVQFLIREAADDAPEVKDAGEAQPTAPE